MTKMEGIIWGSQFQRVVIITMARGMVRYAGMVLESWLRSHRGSTNRKWREHTGWT